MVTDRTIGHGAHARVHLAIDVNSGQQVACKVHDLTGRVNSSGDSLRRIRQEAVLLSHLDHVVCAHMYAELFQY